jgi:demethylmenaquinone methyltransferase/2-methoxy-6-polyprenyl-1,4-benzoquinol methylase
MNVDKSEERIRRMFGEISGRYDFLNHLLSGGTDYYWRWRAVRTAPPVGNAPVLDVCTGTGDLAIAYWKKGGGRVPVWGRLHARNAVTGGDQSRAEQISRTRCSPAALRRSRVQRLPFADDQFQIVQSRSACGT